MVNFYFNTMSLGFSYADSAAMVIKLR
jgi:hypothetical protein